MSTTQWRVDLASLRAARADRELRVTDLVLFALLPMRTLEIAGYPVNELAMAALVVLALPRRRPHGRRVPGLAVLLVALVLGLLAWSGFVNEVDMTRRMGHLAIWAGIAWATASGRVSLRSAGIGALGGLLIASTAWFLGVNADRYEGRLTGLLGDPNAAAYFLVVLGAVALAHVPRRREHAAAVALLLALLVVLTFSRTGLLACAFGVLWLTLGRRLGVVGGAVLAGLLAWFVAWLPDDLRLWGPFADRGSSDLLREQILARERELLADASWYGGGPGTAVVDLDGQRFFFHSSYLAVRQEGGWPTLLAVLALLALAFVAVARSARAGHRPAMLAQLSLVGVVVVSTSLGEVLLELPTAVALGVAWRVASLQPRGAPPPAPGDTP